MHAAFRQKMKERTKEHNERRRQEMKERQKQEQAVMHLHHITRKIPPRCENTVVAKKTRKERNYLQMRQATNTQEQTLLKQMVNKELDDERKELIDLAERVGYLDPNRHAFKAERKLSKVGSSGSPSFQNEHALPGVGAVSRQSSQPDLSKRAGTGVALKKRGSRTTLQSFSQAHLSRVGEMAQTTKNQSKSPFKKVDLAAGNAQHVPNGQSSLSALSNQFALKASQSQVNFSKASDKQSQLGFGGKPMSTISLLKGARMAKNSQTQAEFMHNLRKTKHQIHAFFHRGQAPTRHHRQAMSTQVKFLEKTVIPDPTEAAQTLDPDELAERLGESRTGTLPSGDPAPLASPNMSNKKPSIKLKAAKKDSLLTLSAAGNDLDTMRSSA